jgi:uncharacterized protein
LFYGKKGREESALKWYEKGANSGNTKAMIYLGWAYQSVKKDISTAVNWYEKAALKADPLAMKLLGDVYLIGEGIVLQNSEKALSLYKKAADLGNFAAMLSLGNCYKDGKIVPINGITALDWYTKGVQTTPKDENDKKYIGILYLAIIDLYYKDEALEKDYAKVEELANSSRQIINDDKETLAYLGEIYRIGGYGIKKDTDKSFEYYNEAFKSGETAFNLLGMAEMYHKGYGATKVIKKGSVAAISLIGSFQSYGPSKDKNKANELFVKAIGIYKKSANDSANPNIDSIKKLVQIYEEGIGCNKDKKEANYWRTKLENLK